MTTQTPPPSKLWATAALAKNQLQLQDCWPNMHRTGFITEGNPGLLVLISMRHMAHFHSATFYLQSFIPKQRPGPQQNQQLTRHPTPRFQKTSTCFFKSIVIVSVDIPSKHLDFSSRSPYNKGTVLHVVLGAYYFYLIFMYC